ncbi:VTT domain-containing protein [Sedimenticola selenatireducens]|uniref:VTT domain-containing protein n=1 Tax=Sedimenticola selenatireducens TaxID=191960 RepID=UPI00048DF3F5|nr:VTT domain-containing protein [Sedimenticola selenatireducens]
MKSRSLRWLLVALLAMGVALTVLYQDRLDVAALQQWIQQAGAAAPLLFILIYAIGALFFLPGSALTLAGGALFGPVWGTLWNLTGATLGAALAFLAARYLGAEWVQRRAGPKLKRLTDGVAAEGWRFVAFVRLVPLFPFNLLNYALGLTRISFLPYLLATWIFMLPGALAYTYLGYAGREAVAGGEGVIQKGLLALALLAVVAFLPRLIAKLRERPMLEVSELKQRLDAGENLLVLDVRTASDFVGEQGHLVAAQNLPLEELPARVEELEPWLEQTVALVCRTDRRSAKAAAILAGAGFSDVHVVGGGMTAWLGHGWPVEEVQLKKE